MKKQNLDETWELCLKMWKWIVKEWKKEKVQSVKNLKKQWLENNGIDNLKDDCFFCDYATIALRRSKREKSACRCYCPASKIDKSFSCTSWDYDYYVHPDLFYKKLLELNRKRKKK